MSAPKGKTITLICSDEQNFNIQENIAFQSRTLTAMIAADNHDNTEILILLTNVTGTILAKVIEYCDKHAADDGCITDVEKDWDVEFVNVDAATLTHLTKAASFLKIKSLQNLTLQKVSEMIRYRTTGEILNLFPDLFRVEEVPVKR
ncbi:SKP1-like protein 1A [Papaver somniferum]|uniref:SKP1-like protein 1A n=1 Tax=Papaver somniferum TaxID=3469 RepID=UPI000E6FEB02|nr:SKP1-like protein 1A [Papaver somniferum]